MDNVNYTDQAIQVIDPRSEKRENESGSSSIHFHQNNYVQINLIKIDGLSCSMSDQDIHELELHHKLQKHEEMRLEKSKRRIEEMEDRIKQLEIDLA